MRRAAPAISIRETRARAGPIRDVSRNVFALVRVVCSRGVIASRWRGSCRKLVQVSHMPSPEGMRYIRPMRETVKIID